METKQANGNKTGEWKQNRRMETNQANGNKCYVREKEENVRVVKYMICVKQHLINNINTTKAKFVSQRCKISFEISFWTEKYRSVQEITTEESRLVYSVIPQRMDVYYLYAETTITQRLVTSCTDQSNRNYFVSSITSESRDLMSLTRWKNPPSLTAEEK
ncbi:unnamed protein product [Mytilus edulis]|uniref:Uncharacterized protein n=1 Tax=Mytilus edulis TaxID=6550 RepID=A0A8S3UDW8_MYTED|nr:unnamed protein product [Mytilus edulis]